MSDKGPAAFRAMFGVAYPVIQAPMTTVASSAMVAVVSGTGGLGSLPCSLLEPEEIRAELRRVRETTVNPVNLNFICPPSGAPNAADAAQWRQRLAVYYAEWGLDPATPYPELAIRPFESVHCEIVDELRPGVVSFHFGLPDAALVSKLKKTGTEVISTATTVAEARWLEGHGCDAVIAQGWEAGGHRGTFLGVDARHQLGTMALVPQVVDAVTCPVIAAGGIADARGVVAAIALGAAAVQVGTAYLFCPEAIVPPTYRTAIEAAGDDRTVITNVLSGLPARAVTNRVIEELGPMAERVPTFPLPMASLAPLRMRSEREGLSDFGSFWAGQALRLCRHVSASELTRALRAAAR